MAYAGYLRTLWQRVKVANDRATLVGNITVSEALENATTSVAEFTLADRSGVNYKRGVVVSIDELNANAAGGGGNTLVRKIFSGQLDHVKASSYPNTVTVVATGVLGNLRLTTDKDVDLTGMTDQVAARKILQVCKVPFQPNDIKGSGTSLGQREDVIWESGSTGAAMLEELDRVFGYATVENGEGRVQRIKYSRVPDDYPNNIPNYREFYRGQPGVTFYSNERERGHIDQVINFWKVNGLEYEIGDTETDGDGDGITQEGKEGCARKIWAECKDENHKLLGNNVYVGGEVTSDLIQSPGLAKAICKRMMEWYNRESDTVRVGCANDPRVNVGDLMFVRDSAFGIDLDARERYIIINIQRDGDQMVLDGLGGEKGRDGNVTGGIEECCGTFTEDNKCDKNPKPDDTDPPPLPDLPEPPEDGEDEWCDPAVDPTCIPNDGGPGGGGGTTDPDPGDPGPGGGGTGPGPGGGVDPGPGGGTNTTDEYICTELGVTCDEDVITPAPAPAPGSTTLGAPTGGVPQGQITGGMDWALINQWDSLIVPAAAAHGATASRLKAMLVVESGGVSGANGEGGAVGLMQVKPEYWSAEAATLGYDLYTDAGQIGMAAAIIGGDVAATSGMDEETAFLTVYYPVLDGEGNLCLSCYGESGHTPQMYLDDLDMLMAAINAAPGGSGGGSTTAPPAGGKKCTPSGYDGPMECETNADCGTGKWCIEGGCRCRSSIACTTAADCVGGSCAGSGFCVFPCNAMPDGDEPIEAQECLSHSECGAGDGSDHIFCHDGYCHCPSEVTCDMTNFETQCAHEDGHGYCDPVLLKCNFPCDPEGGDAEGPTGYDMGTAAPGLCHTPGWNIHRYYDGGDTCEIDGYFYSANWALAKYLSASGSVERFGIIARPSIPGISDPDWAYFNSNAHFTLINKLNSEAGEPGGTPVPWRAENLLRFSNTGIICVEGKVRFSVPNAQLGIHLDGFDDGGNLVEDYRGPTINFYASPGQRIDAGYCTAHYASAIIRNHGTGDVNDICRPAGHNVQTDGPAPSIFGNWDGSVVKLVDDAPNGGPLNTDLSFKVCFWVGDGSTSVEAGGVGGWRERYIAASPVDPYLYKNTTLEGDFGETTASFHPVLAALGYYPNIVSEVADTGCIAAFHGLTFSLIASAPDPGDVTTYDGQVMVQVWDISLTGTSDSIIGDGSGGAGGTGTGPDGTGTGNCYPNPDYIPPGGTDPGEVDPGGECISHSDCGVGNWCLDGVCHCPTDDPCDMANFPTQCPGGGYCDPVGLVCLYPCEEEPGGEAGSLIGPSAITTWTPGALTTEMTTIPAIIGDDDTGDSGYADTISGPVIPIESDGYPASFTMTMVFTPGSNQTTSRFWMDGIGCGGSLSGSDFWGVYFDTEDAFGPGGGEMGFSSSDVDDIQPSTLTDTQVTIEMTFDHDTRARSVTITQGGADYSYSDTMTTPFYEGACADPDGIDFYIESAESTGGVVPDAFVGDALTISSWTVSYP